MTDTAHTTVLLTEAIEALAIKPDGIYIDATFGRGGHSQALMKQLSEKGQLVAIDRDPAAIEYAKAQWADEPRFSITHAPFSEIAQVAAKRNISGKVDGILFDLGVSSPQLDDAERGFSFLKAGPLDMRMDPTRGQSAADWINTAAEKDISAVLKTYGEERFAKRIAGAIVAARVEQPFETTDALAEVVKAANPNWERHKHPATRAFQAIRIFINRELDEIKAALAQSVDILSVGGRLVVISFHSLEDRIVKRFIRDNEQSANYPKGMPVTHEMLQGRLKKCGKAIKPGAEEIKTNPRARSAVLRVAQRLA